MLIDDEVSARTVKASFAFGRLRTCMGAEGYQTLHLSESIQCSGTANTLNEFIITSCQET